MSSLIFRSNFKFECSHWEKALKCQITVSVCSKKRKLSNGDSQVIAVTGEGTSSQPARGKGKARPAKCGAKGVRGKAKAKVETRAMRKRRRDENNNSGILRGELHGLPVKGYVATEQPGRQPIGKSILSLV